MNCTENYVQGQIPPEVNENFVVNKTQHQTLTPAFVYLLYTPQGLFWPNKLDAVGKIDCHHYKTKKSRFCHLLAMQVLLKSSYLQKL